jgi:hypothetical protein
MRIRLQPGTSKFPELRRSCSLAQSCSQPRYYYMWSTCSGSSKWEQCIEKELLPSRSKGLPVDASFAKSILRRVKARCGPGLDWLR